MKVEKLRYFFVYICFEALNTSLGLIINNHFRNVQVYEIQLRIYNIFEYLIISLIIYDNITNSVIKNIIRITIFLFIGFCIYDYFVSKHGVVDFDPVVVESILINLFLIYLFFEKINNDDSEFLYQLRIFWIAVALFIYFSGTFFLFLYSRTETKDKAFMVQYTVIFSSIIIIKNIILLISILLRKKTLKDNNSIDFASPNFDYSKKNFN